jgi:hypothetical protein
MSKQIYLVDGTHPHPNYVLSNAEFEVSENTYEGVTRFYAVNALLGCGRDSVSAEKAIRSLCSYHAIVVTRIVEAN